MQDEGSVETSRLKVFQKSLMLDAFVFYVLVVKRMNFETNLVF